ncbi:histidine phosphatase family protein [Streptomyces sp. NPDC002640]
MITYVLRHGQTDHSRRYLVNGDPAKPILLDEEGRRSLGGGWSSVPLHGVKTWLASEFPRARQTAQLLMGVPGPELVVEPRLNELDYGEFEGGPFLEYAAWLEGQGAHRRPPGSRESQTEGIRRMLTGVLAALDHQGPRVLVSHGLLLSVLLWNSDRVPGEAPPLFFPEAPYAEPVAISDDDLPRCVGALIKDLETGVLERPAVECGDGDVMRVGEGAAVATVGPEFHHSPDQKDLPHA